MRPLLSFLQYAGLYLSLLLFPSLSWAGFSATPTSVTLSAVENQAPFSFQVKTTNIGAFGTTLVWDDNITWFKSIVPSSAQMTLQPGQTGTWTMVVDIQNPWSCLPACPMKSGTYSGRFTLSGGGQVTTIPVTLTIKPSTSTTVSSITLSPPAPSIQVHQTQQFTATARDANGAPIAGISFAWASSVPAVASIDSSGLAHGLSPGTTTITATNGTIASNPITLTVTPSTVSSITLSPPAPSIQVNQTQQFTATALDASGTPITGLTFAWASSAPAVASIDSSGLAHGLSPGTTTITATNGTVTSNQTSLLVTTASSTSTGYVYPLKLGSTSRYLVDQNGKPFLLVGDAAWSLIAAVSDSDADLYLANRQQLGFDAVLVSLLEHKFSKAPPADFYGLLPFTGKVFISPNEAYFSHADTILRSASAKGIVVFLDVLYLGYQCGDEGWCSEVESASTSDMTAWGQYLGNRYKNYDNIVWVIGADMDPSPVKSKVQAMVDGILSVDTRHLFTAHNAPEMMGVTPWSGAAWLNVNTVYTNNPAYQMDLVAYANTPVKPYFLIEALYENSGPTAQALRAQSYWTVLSGGFGHIFGNCPIWGFGFTSGFCTSTDWKAQLASPGSTNMQRFQALFNSRRWYTLVPDTLHTVMTSGYGVSGQSTYATTAYASDGSSIIAYLPSSRTVTISGSRISGPTMIAWWFNPRTGAATQVGTFATTGTQTFTPPSTGDWVLVLDSAALAFPAPGTQ